MLFSHFFLHVTDTFALLCSLSLLFFLPSHIPLRLPGGSALQPHFIIPFIYTHPLQPPHPKHLLVCKWSHSSDSVHCRREQWKFSALNHHWPDEECFLCNLQIRGFLIPCKHEMEGLKWVFFMLISHWASQVALVVKKLQETKETPVQSLGQEDSPGRGHRNLQCSCLENPMDIGA